MNAKRNSFVYKWIHNESGKTYVGYHKGSVNDNYVCSINKNNPNYDEFWAAHKNNELSRTIVAGGLTDEEALRLEHIIWKIEKRKGTELYNPRKWNAHRFQFDSAGNIVGPMEGRPVSQETRDKISKSTKGKIKRSDEYKEKLSKSLMGHEVSEETRAKISKANKGRKRSGDVRKAISKRMKGKTLSEEHKRKIGAANKGKRKGMKDSDEVRAKKSENIRFALRLRKLRLKCEKLDIEFKL